MPQSKELRERKALVSSLLSRSAASQYEPYQWLESFRMLRDIVATPEEYNEIFDHWSTVMGSRMLYGRAMPERNGPQAEIMDITHKIEQTVQPGAYLVDVLPWMQYLPDAIAPWKRYIKGLSRRDEDFYTMMWNFTRQDLENGRDVPSWARLCMEDLEKEKGKHNMTEHESIHLVGALYTAFGTTSHNLKSFILAAVRHPDWWDRIREEMDKVVGGDRLPTLDDVPSLPLMRAFVTEMTRVWPVTPGGVPHVLVKDDFYEGYHLPAGSVVHIVAWACGRNPETYPEPNEFKPERWLEPTYPTYKEPLTEFPTLNNTVLFGAGRRQCPGMLVGTRNVYIQAMMLIWACDIKRAKDASGKEIIPPFYDFVHGFNVGPNKFDFELTPRSQERLDMVEAAYAEALAADPMRK
jgi:cytochrome P450